MEKHFKSPVKSLVDLVGSEYMNAVCQANSFFSERDQDFWDQTANEKIDFYPEKMQKQLENLLHLVGKNVCTPYTESAKGAATDAFRKATNKKMSPIAGFGFYRIGEDGKLYLASKSEHYHASLGHLFPGYNLISKAVELGINNVTHNNTRGHITRLLEERLIALANGLDFHDRKKIEEVIVSDKKHTLNRVINLETGSLAVEAAVKMMLAQFYRLDSNTHVTVHKNKIPVFFVMADYEGGKQANYHGTTLITQMMRGLWPEISEKMQAADIMKVCAVSINDIDDFKDKTRKYNSGKYRIAGFLHELILMNYGGIKLDKIYIQQVYQICHEEEIPVLVDEIQSCMWSPEIFAFREYGLSPDFISVGKGFPGGQYPASRIITTKEMDNLSQFGALVTNGQEELASLAYLITIEFACSNKDRTESIGNYYVERLQQLKNNHPGIITKVEGLRHLSSLFFKTVDECTKFVDFLNKYGIDISAQRYKPDCPPAALTKLPLTSSRALIDFLIDKMEEALTNLYI